MNRLRVAIDGRLANEAQPAGVGRYTIGMLRGLREVAPDLALEIYLDEAPRPEFPLSADEATFRVLPRARFWTHRVLGPALRRDKPDVFYSPLTQLPLFCPRPAVAVVHDLAYYDFSEHFTRRQRFVARMQTRYVVRRATLIAADSEATRADLLQRFPLDAGRVQVTLAGVDPVFAPVSEEAARPRLAAQYGIAKPYFLYVGRLQPRKNIARLIAAFDALKTKQPDLPHELVIAGGGGWLMESIAAARDQARHKDAIRMIGRVEESDLPPLYGCATATCLVSLWEGFGFPVLESMACGVPVLCANVSSLPEVAGDCAIQVDPTDSAAIEAALATLANETPEARATRIQRGITHAQRFTWPAAATRLAEVLRQAATM